jgi:hypothetical protein
MPRAPLEVFSYTRLMVGEIQCIPIEKIRLSIDGKSSLSMEGLADFARTVANRLSTQTGYVFNARPVGGAGRMTKQGATYLSCTVPTQGSYCAL